MKKIKITVLLLGFFAIAITSCNEDSPGVEYMPDMYRSRAIETYSETILTTDNKSALQPAQNTIPRGHLPYPFPNTNEGYEMAGENLKNPIPFSEEELKRGKEVYSNFCVHCHGKKGDGKGSVPENSDYPNPPAYQTQLKDLPAGKIFHTLMYGKNLMGSHASQISREDRWRLVYYVQSLQDPERFDQWYRGANPESASEEKNQTETETVDGESTGEMAMN